MIDSNDTIKKPNFLGVGAMKSATTWISECLRYHPDVFISNVKELHFFSNNWNKGLDWYFSKFKDASRKKVIGEFSVSYMDRPDYADSIYEVLGPIKIIISVRNPIDRFISHYKHNCRVEADAEKFNNEQLDMATFKKATERFPEMLEKGLYTAAISKFQQVFGGNNVLVIFKEDIDTAPMQVMQQIFDFLGIDNEFIPPIVNKTVSVGITPKMRSLERLRVFLYRKSKRYFPKMIVWIRKLRMAELYRTLNKKSIYFDISPDVRKELQKYYRTDIKEMQQLFSRNLNHWENETPQ